MMFSRILISIFAVSLSFPLFSGCGGSTSAVGVSPRDGQLEPGATLIFREDGALRVTPDEIEIATAYPGLPFGFAAANDQTVPLSTFLQAGYSFGRSTASIVQSNDFSIQPGKHGETVIHAQFGGTVNVGGFLSVMGLGSASMEVTIKVLDVTDGIENARVVAVHPVESYEIANAAELGADISVGGQVGSATIGEASVDLAIGMAVPFDRTIVRDRTDFGFTALLRRGHDYRFQVCAESKLEIGVSGGNGIVSFYNPLAPIPNEIVDPAILAIPPQVLDVDSWLDSLNWPLLDLEVPAINLPTNVAQFTIPAHNVSVGNIDLHIPGVSPKIKPTYPAPFQNVQDTNDMLEVLGFNTNMRDILAENINRPIPEDPLLIRGIELEDLTIDLANDTASDLKEILANLD